MEGLPPEIQLLIIEKLDVLDILHLQQVRIVFPASHPVFIYSNIFADM
jgi:hypothetical protein